MSACIGKWHLDDWNTYGGVKKAGFDYYEGLIQGGTDSYFTWTKTLDSGEARTSEDYITSSLTDAAIKWIQENQDKHFFLWLAHVAPHAPFHIPPSNLHNNPYLK